MPQKDRLDTQERLLLAVQAVRGGDDGKAMRHINAILKQEPHNGNARHLLAGIYASQGAQNKAVEELEHALADQPDLHVARFQLGLLHFSIGEVALANDAWDPLENLGDGHYLYFLRRGMQHLGRLAYADCIENLKTGVSMNKDNPHLNGDMLIVVAKAEQMLNQP